MTERPELEQVLADRREAAAILRANGHKAQADSIEEVCDAVAGAKAVNEYLLWLSEDDAVSKSGRAVEWLRTQFPAWVDRGLARWDPKKRRKRQYRSIIVPQRANLEAARAQARRDAAA